MSYKGKDKSKGKRGFVYRLVENTPLKALRYGTRYTI